MPARTASNAVRLTWKRSSAIVCWRPLQFLGGWLARDPDRLGPSLAEFAGQPGYGTAQLRQDLDRFIFLLGGDGESLFGPGAAQ